MRKTRLGMPLTGELLSILACRVTSVWLESNSNARSETIVEVAMGEL